MREIKFRAWDKGWDKNEEKMIYGIDECLMNWDLLKNRVDRFLNMSSHIPIMQYTGLNDKNGKEIYERDLIQVSDLGIAEVVYGFHITSKDDWSVEHGTMGFTLKWVGTEDYSELCPRDDIEIIGNIYENSELLGTNKEA